ncbi:hypothetical protein GC163_13430 [bacterium]|nr:hypothetical protein [bacterium]
MSQSGTQAASLVNAGEDFEICIDTQEKSGDRIFLTKLRYRFGPCINDGHCCNEIMLEIGPAEAIEQTAKLIRDWIQMLELDCTHPCAKSD